MTLTANPASLDFGQVAAGETKIETVNLTPDAGPATCINSISLPPAYTCDLVLPLLLIAPLNFNVTFAPETLDDSGEVIIDYTEGAIELKGMDTQPEITVPEDQEITGMDTGSEITIPEIHETIELNTDIEITIPEIHETTTMNTIGSVE